MHFYEILCLITEICPFFLWLFLFSDCLSLSSMFICTQQKFKLEQPISRVRGVSDLIQRGRPWVWHPWVQIQASEGEQVLGRATEKKHIVLVYILQVDLNQISWKGGKEVSVLFMFMPLMFLSVWPAVFFCESGICAQTHYWLNLGTWSQSNLLSIWQEQEDIWKWKRWCYMCQGAAEVSYSARQCKSEAEGWQQDR